MTVRFASAPISWGVESANDPRNPDPDLVLSATATAGYQGCELGAPGYFGSVAGHIAPRFASVGLEVVAIWMDIPLAAPLSSATASTLRQTCQLLQELDARHVIISDLITEDRIEIVGQVESNPDLWWNDDDWRQVRETVLEVEALADAHGRTLSVHPHVGGHVESGREIGLLLDQLDRTGVGLCVDTGHVTIGGSDPVALIADQFDRIRHLHAKDVNLIQLEALQAGECDYLESVGSGLYCDLGTGSVDWAAYRDAVDSKNYDGWIVVEQDALPGYDHDLATQSNNANFRFLHQLFNPTSEKD